MYNTSNEILMESAEIELLVTEGLVDKSKKAFTNIIKKIKEFIRKVLTYIKSKLTNKIKAVDNNIKKAKVDETETETLDEPITLANSEKLNNLLKYVEKMVNSAKKISTTYNRDLLDELHNTMTNEYDNLMSLYEKCKDDIDETYTKITPSMYDIYGKINRKCLDIADMIGTHTRILDDELEMYSKSPGVYSAEYMKLLAKTQAIITKALTVTEFVTNSCNRSITNLYH